MSVWRRTVLLGSVLALCTPAPALAAERFAAPGSALGTGDCPASAPCRIDHALNDAAFGDLVTLQPGDYTTGALLNVRGITLRGQPGAPRPTITGTSDPYVLAVSSGAGHPTSVRHIAVRSETQMVTGLWVSADVDPVLIEDVDVQLTGNTSTGASMEGQGPITLRDSLIRVIGADVVALRTRPRTANATVRNVTAVASGANTTALRAEGEAGGPAGPDCEPGDFGSSTTVRNTILRGTGARGFDVKREQANVCGSVPATIRVSAGTSNFRADAVTTTNAPAGALDLSPGGNQTEPAQTDDAAIFADELHQRPTAPTANAGSNEGVGSADLDGELRTGDGTADIGADELPSAPVVSTGAASDVARDAATLTGTVDAKGFATTVALEYGPTAAYGSRLELPAPAAEGAGPVTVAGRVAGLAPGSTYHFRLVATGGTALQPRAAQGADATFTTAPPPAPLAGLSVRARQRLRSVLRKGIAATFTVGLAGSRARVQLGRGAGRRMPKVLGSRTRDRLAAGMVTVRVRLSKASRRALRHRRRVRIVLRVTVTPPGGPPASASAPVTLVR